MLRKLIGGVVVLALCVGIAMANTRPLMPAPGGAGRVTGNNPIALAVPCGDGEAIVTRGRGWTSTRSRPTAASRPTCAAPMTVPERTATSPGWTSSPARRT